MFRHLFYLDHHGSKGHYDRFKSTYVQSEDHSICFHRILKSGRTVCFIGNNLKRQFNIRNRKRNLYDKKIVKKPFS